MKQSKQNRKARQPKGTKGRVVPLNWQPPSLTIRRPVIYTAVHTTAESSAGAGGFKFFRMNSAFCVDTTVGSTQQVGYTSMASMYQNYRVHHARIKVDGFIGGGSTSGTFIVSVVPQPYSTSLPATVTAWSVQPHAITTQVPYVTNGGPNKVKLDKTYELWKVANVPKSVYLNDLNYTGAVTGNPTTQIYFAVTVLSTFSGTLATLTYQTTVALDVEFFNPLLLSS